MRIAICVALVLGYMELVEGYCTIPGYHECHASADCIPNFKVCDGKGDCFYGDDEQNCHKTTTFHTTTTTSTTTIRYSCEVGEYQCLNGQCIPDKWVCDGIYDCSGSGDDEQGCPKVNSIAGTDNGISCPDDEYQCKNIEECISYSRVCDGLADCPFADDEHDCKLALSNATSPILQRECASNFDYIHGSCVLVDPFTVTTWDEARYLCEMFNSDLVVLDNFNFYAELLQYIMNKGLDSHSYWVGATDREIEGVWRWIDYSPVSTGAPLWALYGCTGDYHLEPRPSTAMIQDCGFLDMGRGMHMSEASCDDRFATICQTSWLEGN